MEDFGKICDYSELFDLLNQYQPKNPNSIIKFIDIIAVWNGKEDRSEIYVYIYKNKRELEKLKQEQNNTLWKQSKEEEKSTHRNTQNIWR